MHWHEWRANVSDETYLMYEYARMYAEAVNAPEKVQPVLFEYARMFLGLANGSENVREVATSIEIGLCGEFNRLAYLDDMEQLLSAKNRSFRYHARKQVAIGQAMGLKGMGLLAGEYGLWHMGV
jgi:hypothetical protein